MPIVEIKDNQARWVPIIGSANIVVLQEDDGTLKVSVVSHPEETQVFENEAITDLLDHESTIADISYYSYATLYVESTLDEIVSIQPRANRSDAVAGSVPVGASFNVTDLTGIEARTLTLDTTGWLPYLYIVATALVAPTLGVINAYVIGRN